MPTSNIIPVGGVALYSGDLSVAANLSALTAAGWLPCDGTSYPVASYPDLYAAIGTGNGGNNQAFNVPKLQDRFVRGVSAGSTADPNAATRAAAAPGGAAGNLVGSLQTTATAAPASAWSTDTFADHTHTYAEVNNDMHETWEGTSYDAARWSNTSTVGPAGGHNHTISGGDPRTAPVSLALYWIIRATAPAAGAGGTTPGGAIAAFAGTIGAAPGGWLECNGMAEAIQGPYADLVAVIGSDYGGDGTTVFNLPDFRGRFLRGTAHGMATDPNASSRSQSAPGSNSGDAVGSFQGFATGLPQSPFLVTAVADHTHSCSNVPVTAHGVISVSGGGPAAKNVMEWAGPATATSADGSHSHSVTGGDVETRPENIYLDWLVASQDLSDAPPIGAIMPFAGDLTSLNNLLSLAQDGWYPCAGQSLKISDSDNAALYAVIGGTYGQSNLNFKLPDLRGYFVTGAGGTRAVGSKSSWTTGAPLNPFTTTTVADHTHTISGTYTDDQMIDVCEGGFNAAMTNSEPVASSPAGGHGHALIGTADAESRPINVTVDYMIRFK